MMPDTDLAKAALSASGGGKAHLLLGRGAHQYSSISIFSRATFLTRVISAMSSTGLAEVVGAGFEAPNSVRRPVERRHHDDRQMLGARIGLELPADFEPVDAGHHQI